MRKKKNTAIADDQGDIVMKKTLTVEGMMCMHCVKHVHDALEKEIEDRRRRNLESLYRWAEARGLSKESVDRALEETRDER